MFAWLHYRQYDPKLTLVLLCLVSYCSHVDGAPRLNIKPHATTQNIPIKSYPNQIQEDAVNYPNMREKMNELAAMLGIFDAVDPNAVNSNTKTSPRIKTVVQHPISNLQLESTREGLATPYKPNQLPTVIEKGTVKDSTPNGPLIVPQPISQHNLSPNLNLKRKHDFIKSRNTRFFTTHKSVGSNTKPLNPSLVKDTRIPQNDFVSKAAKGHALKHTMNTFQPIYNTQISSTQERQDQYKRGVYQRPRSFRRPSYVGFRRLFTNQQQNAQYNNRQRKQYRAAHWSQRKMPARINRMKDFGSSLMRTKLPENPHASTMGVKSMGGRKDWMKLPRASVYPGGKCKLSTNHSEESIRIGQCRPIPSPCNVGEEAPEICGNFFKCCVSSGNHTETLTRGISQHKISAGEIKKTLPLATVFPRGMCRTSKENELRVGTCLPAYLNCQLIQQYSATTENVQNKLEAVAFCRRTHPSQNRMLCCAPKIAKSERHGSSFDTTVHSNPNKINTKTTNATETPEKGKLVLPNIVLF